MKTFSGVCSIKIADTAEEFYELGSASMVVLVDHGDVYTRISARGGNGGAYGVDVEIEPNIPLIAECEHGTWIQDTAANTITCSRCGKVE